MNIKKIFLIPLLFITHSVIPRHTPSAMEILDPFTPKKNTENNNPQPIIPTRPILIYLKAETAKITPVLVQHVNKAEKEVLETISKALEHTEKENMPHRVAAKTTVKAISQLWEEKIKEEGALLDRKILLDTMCNCIDEKNKENPSITEKENVQLCLQRTDAFIKNRYGKWNCPEDELVTNKEFNRIKQEIDALISTRN